MKNHNGTFTLFLIALAIVGIVVYVASYTYGINLIQNIAYLGG